MGKVPIEQIDASSKLVLELSKKLKLEEELRDFKEKGLKAEI